MSPATPPFPIAFCITELDRGGAERALCQLVNGLDRKTWLPRVYCLGPRGHFVDSLEAHGVIVECFNARRVTSVPRVIFQLTRSLRRFRPALLQTFLFHGNLVGRIAGKLAGVPKIVSGIRVAERRSRWYGRIDRWTNGLVDQNVCVSQGVADFSAQETGLLPRKLTVISNGVELDRFTRAKPADLASMGIPQGCPVILTVGRLEEQKGIVYLLQAAVDVLKQQPACRFLIVGDGPDRASLEEMAQSLGIARSILFTGGRSDVPELLKAATLFVLPSLWEGMPNALLEAMAAPLPVIATAVEGSREVLQSGVTGLLVKPADPVELSKAILTLIGDPSFAAELATNSQHVISERFTAQAAIDAYDNLYRQLIQRDGI